MVPVRSAIDQAIIDDVRLARIGNGNNENGSSWNSRNRNLPYPNILFSQRPANFDADRDGMGDAWEERTFGSTTPDNNEDHDNDGYTNLEEYLHHLSDGLSTPLTLVANFTYGATHGQFPLTVEFDASLSNNTEGSIEFFEWGFGDGGTGSKAMVSHTYAQPGKYTVTLTVTDNEGNTTTTNKTLTLTTPELVAHWKLDEGSGSVVKDSTGKNVDSQIQGAEWRTEGDRTALYFDGGTDYVQVPMTGMSTKAGTIALWARSGSTSDALRCLVYHTTFPVWSDRIHLFTDPGSDGLILGIGHDHWLHKDIVSLIPGTWFHIAFSWEDESSAPGQGSYRIYVDGLEKASGTYSGFNKMGEFADIGNDGNPESRIYAFDGLIHDVRMYNYALNADEIQSLLSPGGNTCDVNGDGSVDVRDMQSCANHILNIQDWGTSADVNEDGEANVLDIQAIIICVLDR
jgi:PKD repeat protein